VRNWGSDRLSLPSSLTTDLAKVQTRLDSQTFRVAIVGDFSRGKSTLLNALLGEKIQPVRAIPCSGTVTVLRYGATKRVIARYRDGREEEIPFEQYQEKASISEEAALSNQEDELNSDLLELVLEHPGLALCQQGVELVDSPGLNERSDRTLLTQELLKNVDAVIFLAHALQPLAEGERNSLKNLRLQLNGGDASRPAENLFVVVNFMDMLRGEQDHQQVKQLCEKSLLGKDVVLSSPDHLHFISARSALDAILAGKAEDEFLVGLQNFISELESQLVKNKNHIQQQRNLSDIRNLMQSVSISLEDYQKSLFGEIVLSIESKRHIIGLVGEAGSLSAKFHEEIRQAKSETESLIKISIGDLFERTLCQRISEKSNSWNLEDECDRNKILKSFHHKFQADASAILDEWMETEIRQNCMAKSLNLLDRGINELAQNFQQNIESVGQETGSQVSQQFGLSLQRRLPNFQISSQEKSDDKQFWSAGIAGGIGLGGGGLLAGVGAIAVSSIAFFPVILTGATITGIAVAGAAIGTSIGTALGFFSAPNQEEIRKEVLRDGLKNLRDNAMRKKIEESIEKFVIESFEQSHINIKGVINDYLKALDSELIRHEESEKRTSIQVEVEQAWGDASNSRIQILSGRIN
jgi:Dynamin family